VHFKMEEVTMDIVAIGWLFLGWASAMFFIHRYITGSWWRKW